jgi:hypothetical protein
MPMTVAYAENAMSSLHCHSCNKMLITPYCRKLAGRILRATDKPCRSLPRLPPPHHFDVFFWVVSFIHPFSPTQPTKKTHIDNMGEPLAFKGSLAAHAGMVTAIATSSENPDMILTASRGEYKKRRRCAEERTPPETMKTPLTLFSRQDHHRLAAHP